MSSKENEKKLVKETMNDLLKSRYMQEVGQKARVDRSPIEQNEQTEQLREVLRDIGLNLAEIGVAPKGMKYLGSLSVHIYASEILRTSAFATVTETSELPGPLADAGLRELTRKTMLKYGKSPGKLRSGF